MAFERFDKVCKTRFDGKRLSIDSRGLVYFPRSLVLPQQCYELLYDSEQSRIGFDFTPMIGTRKLSKVKDGSYQTSIRALTNFYEIPLPQRCKFSWEANVLCLQLNNQGRE